MRRLNHYALFGDKVFEVNLVKRWYMLPHILKDSSQQKHLMMNGGLNVQIYQTTV